MKALLLLLSLAMPLLSNAQTKAEPPGDSAAYAATVKNLEAGQVDIDYRAFRESYLESPEYTAAISQTGKQNDRRRELRATMYAGKNAKVIKVAKKILQNDYTDMSTHKALQQTYKAQGDSAEYHKHHAIEFGLLRSIINSGDGKSCATGWHVVQIEEEYFILSMLGAQLKQQSLTLGPPHCDRMLVETDEGEAVYYFEINKVIEMEMKMFKQR